MNSQLSNERKQQPSSLPSSRGNNKQPVATWFSQHSFFRFKLKSAGFFSHSRSSSKSNSSLSSDSSLSRSQSQSTSISKDSIYASSTTSVSNQASVASVKKSSKVGQTLDAMSSKFEAPTTSTIAKHSGRPIRSTVPQTTSEYRQPISNFFATIPGVPGVCSIGVH